MATQHIKPGDKIPRKLKKRGAPNNYDLYKEIKKESLYKNNTHIRDLRSRKYIESQCETTSTAHSLYIGNMVYFDYYTPKTAEQLDYYDAKPVTLIFGRFMSKQGKRVLGFNIHYYPPTMRFKILSKLFSIFSSNFLKKSWWTGQSSDMSEMDYKQVIKALTAAKLEFGVREYIPDLMTHVRVVPPQYFSKLVFTEGYFHKRTREMILNYWKQYKQK